MTPNNCNTLAFQPFNTVTSFFSKFQYSYNLLYKISYSDYNYYYIGNNPNKKEKTALAKHGFQQHDFNLEQIENMDYESIFY